MAFVRSLVLLIFAQSACAAYAQTPSCKHLAAISGPSGYQPRADTARCEGLFQQQVAGSFEFLSFASVKYNLNTDRVLTVKMPHVQQFQNSRIFIEARALNPGMYYRMDAVVPPGETFRWSLADVLRPERIGSDSIGVVAWVEQNLFKYYVPVSVVAENAVGSTDLPTMIVRSPLDIERLVWRSWQENGGSQQSEYATVGGHNPPVIRAGQATKVPLVVQPSGTTVIELTAKFVNQDRLFPQLVRILVP